MGEGVCVGYKSLWYNLSLRFKQTISRYTHTVPKNRGYMQDINVMYPWIGITFLGIFGEYEWYPTPGTPT